MDVASSESSVTFLTVFT